MPNLLKCAQKFNNFQSLKRCRPKFAFRTAQCWTWPPVRNLLHQNYIKWKKCFLLLPYYQLLLYYLKILMQLCTSNLLVDISEQLTFDFKKGEVWNKNWFDCHFHSTFDQILKKFFRSSMMKMDATQGQTTLGRETSICIKFLIFKIISIKLLISCLSINNFHKIGDLLIRVFAVL